MKGRLLFISVIHWRPIRGCFLTREKHAEQEMHNKIDELTKLNTLLEERDAEMKELKKLLYELQHAIRNN